MAVTQLTGQQIKDGGITDADVATLNKDGTTSTPSMRTLGTGSTQACAGNDSRLSDSRAPINTYLNGNALINGYLVASVASNALTIAIKNSAGGDPSSSNPVEIAFRNPTAATGDITIVVLTAATSFVVSSGSTLGTVNGKPFRIWIVGFNDTGIFKLGVVCCTDIVNGVIYPLRDDLLGSSIVEGGAGAADSIGVIYTAAAATTKPIRILGYMEWDAGLTTAGTWASGPTKIQEFGPGISLPGQIVQLRRVKDANQATGTAIIPLDDTIPQITEGTLFMAITVTPTSKINLLVIDSQEYLTVDVVSLVVTALFQDSTANAICSTYMNIKSPGGGFFTILHHMMQAGTISAIFFTLRSGAVDQAPGTTAFNGGTIHYFSGTLISWVEVKELMA